MSEHAAPNFTELAPLCEQYLRPPTRVTGGPHDILDAIFVFDPDLTPDEVATYDALVRGAASTRPMSPTQYSAVRSQMQSLRDLRQIGRSAFMALTAAERDRMMYDAMTAVTVALIAILRDAE
jgi:hypothetical protein